MSEPTAVAARAEKMAEGVWQWTVADDRLGGTASNGQAVEEAPGSVVLVNPVRLAGEELDRLGDVVAILLTGASHLRCAPHYRDLTGAAIWAPSGAELEVDPDETFSDGNELPGDLKAIAIAGPKGDEHAFHAKRGAGVLFVGDALVNLEQSGGLHVLAEPHNPAVAKTRASCRKLLDLPFELVLFGHGEPLREDAKARIEKALGA
jgi:glyoxylase-like metal-dependent hydrolase (beta-lactamase superfamily II)